MPKLLKATPRYRKHRASGQAIVTIEGRDFYLGPHGTKASHAEYDRIVGEWLVNGRRLPKTDDNSQLTMVEFANCYRRFAERDYRKQPSGYHQLHRIRDAVNSLTEMYGRTLTTEFDPKRPENDPAEDDQ